MSIIKDSSKSFECSFCGNIWECKKSKYKTKTLKTNGGKTWKIFTSICPKCKRETTLTEPIVKRSRL